MSMTPLPKFEDYKQLFLDDVPMIDLRAPVEFAKGSFPSAVSMPLMTDAEREAVGTCYKTKGQDAATELGHSLVSGDVKAQRLKHWMKFTEHHPEGVLFCFRGGMRSHITQQWIAESGIKYPLVTGGYKALRRYLIDATDRIARDCNSYVIGGRTGSNKTSLINALQTGVDLEGFANHRGSSFGRPVDGVQPTQISFENALAVRLLKIEDRYAGIPMFYEDEGTRVGGIGLPDTIATTIKTSPMAIVEEDLDFRIDIIHRDYIVTRLKEFNSENGQENFAGFANYLQDALSRVRKRLGGVRYQAINGLLNTALMIHEKKDDDSLHKDWIRQLLVEYYDPMYDYQLSKKEQPIAIRGTGAEILAWAKDQNSDCF